MLIDVVSIGYSPYLLIPENNVINLRRDTIIIGSRRRKRQRPDFISCFTTQGHENPFWVISNNEFSSGPLMNNGTITVAHGDGSVTIVINKISLYQSEIYIDASDANFTGNLTCQSQNNSEAQYTVIITTSKNIPLTILSINNEYFMDI